jgi:predicted metal-dependent hydrolase
MVENGPGRQGRVPVAVYSHTYFFLLVVKPMDLVILRRDPSHHPLVQDRGVADLIGTGCGEGVVPRCCDLAVNYLRHDGQPLDVLAMRQENQGLQETDFD